MIAVRELIKRRMSAGLRRALRGVRLELDVRRRHGAGVKRARQFLGTTPLRLNLGSGFQPKDGWINIDREHKYAYDEETLGRVLESVGFASVSRRAFNPATDAANHAIGSPCMHARKPSLTREQRPYASVA
jgi:hypothetical protein